MMRKGFTLLEMLGVVFILSILMIVTAKPMRNVTVEIPRISRDFETNSSMLDCVRKLRKDVEGAAGMEVYPADESVGGKLLMIGSEDGMICYQFGEGTVVRYKTSGDKGAEYVWKIPNGRIRWQIWHESGAPAAVEVSTSVARKIAGKVRDRLQNSYVFFVGANDAMEGQI
jgi:prepilin-type N-terminal cleavage/methylation domain-containing protein